MNHFIRGNSTLLSIGLKNHCNILNCIVCTDSGPQPAEQNDSYWLEQLWDHVFRARQIQLLYTKRRTQRKKILLDFFCTSYTIPSLVASDKATTDRIVSVKETIATRICWAAVRGKFQCYVAQRRKFPWENLKATGLISPNFWTSYSCIPSFISHKSKQSFKEKLLFSTLTSFRWNTFRWKTI